MSKEAKTYLKKIWGVESVNELTLGQLLNIKENADEGYDLDNEIIISLEPDFERLLG